MKYIRLLKLFVFCALCMPLEAKAADNVDFEARRFIFPSAYSQISAEYIKISNASQEEIGYYIGKVGKEVLNSILIPFADPKYGREKEAFIQKVDPIYAARIKGIKKALGITNDYSKDASYPLYDYRLPACSAIVVPGEFTESGHTLIARNVDWIESEVSAVNGMNKWAYVLQLEPTNGVASLALGSTSLIGAPYDAINAHGLYIAGLADQQSYFEPIDKLAGGTTTRFNHTQIVRSVVDNCASLEDVKALFIKESPLNMAGAGMHYIAVDKLGNTLVIEYDEKKNLVFTEFNQEVVPFTNSAIRLNPSTRTGAKQSDNSYDDYYRYTTVNEFAVAINGKVSEEELWDLMRSVAANSNVASNSGANAGSIFRLYWTAIIDVDAQTMQVKYNLRDGASYADGSRNNLILSNPYYFYLKQ